MGTNASINLPARSNVSPQSAPAPQVSVDFTGMSYEQQDTTFYGADYWPPDTQVAAGPTDVMELENDIGSIWTKSGSLDLSFDLNSFFPVPYGYMFSDPRILYDASAGRWFASGLAFDNYFDSQAYVAVSTSSDPTVSWWVYTVKWNTSGTIYDQPKLGLNSDKVVVSWNDYSSGGSWFSGQETFVLQKSDVLIGASAANTYFGPDPYRFSVVPSQSLTSTNTEYLVYHNADTDSSTVGVVAINGTPRQGNVTWSETDLSVGATSIPPEAVQPGGGPLIDTGDDRLLSATWQNGVLWMGGNDGCVPQGDSALRSCLRLMQVNTLGTSPSLLQSFDVTPLGGYLDYPAVTFDGEGNAFFSFSESSSSIYASAVVAAQSAAGPVDSISAADIVENGVGISNNCGTQCGTSDLYRNRWGDYSGAAVDPVDPSKVWLAAEYAGSTWDTYDWGTGVAEVSFGLTGPTPTPSPMTTNTPTPTSTPSPTFSPTSTSTVTPTPIAVNLQPGVPTMVSAIVGGVTVQVQLPAGENVAQLDVNDEAVSAGIADQIEPDQVVSGESITLSAVDPLGNNLSQVSLPLTIDLTYGAPASLNTRFARVYRVNSSSLAQSVGSTLTANTDGTDTTTFATTSLGQFILGMPGDGTPVPQLYLPAIKRDD